MGECPTPPKCEPKRKEEEALLKLLQMAKDGEYAPVEKSADACTRIGAEDRQVEEAHYCGVS